MRKIILTAAANANASTSMATAASARKRPVVAAVAVRVVPAFKAADTNASKSLSSSEFTEAGGNADNFGLIDRHMLSLIPPTACHFNRCFNRFGTGVHHQH